MTTSAAFPFRPGRARSRVRRVLAGGLAVLLAFAPGGAARGDEPLSSEQQMAAGLRSRMLYDLADRYCDEQLARKELAAVDQANLWVEKVQTQMARAIQTPPSERPEAWNRARQLAESFAAENPGHPRQLLVRVQAGLASLAEARLVLQELAVQAGPANGRADALERLRAARSEFEEILRELREALPAAPTRRDDSGRLTSLQLQALQANLEFQIGTCHLLRGELYDASQMADRLDAFSSAEKSFESVLRVTDAEGGLWYSVQLERVEVARLLGERREAGQRLGNLDVAKLPSNLRPGYWEQKLELATTLGEIRKQLEQVASLVERNPQLELAGLRAVLRAAALADEKERNRWLDSAAEWTRQIETRYGGYWGRLAELTLVGATGSEANSPVTPVAPATPPANSSAGAIEILIRTGDNAAREQRGEDALRAWRKAIATAQAGPHSEAVWRMVLQAHLKVARILEERKAFREAADELLKGVGLQPQNELAPWLQLQAAWCVAQTATGSSEALSEYRRLLEQHVQQYPQAATLNPALLWLARLEGTAGNYRRAADLYLRVDSACEQAVAAAAELERVSRVYLESLSEQPDRARSEARSLSDAIVAKFSAATSGKLVAGSEATRGLLLTAGAIGLRYDTLKPAQLAEWLGNSLVGISGEEPWRQVASAYQLAALAADEQQRGRALELVRSLGEAGPLETALDLLEPVAARHPVANPVRLAVIERLLQVAGEGAADPSDLRLRQAAIWEAAGEEAKALASLEQLAEQLPRRLDVQLRLARALARNPERQTAALSQWRRVSAGVKDRSDEWYEAKYQVARLLLESGQKAEAKKLLDYLSVVPPGWSDSKWKQQFDALYARCK